MFVCFGPFNTCNKATHPYGLARLDAFGALFVRLDRAAELARLRHAMQDVGTVDGDTQRQEKRRTSVAFRQARRRRRRDPYVVSRQRIAGQSVTRPARRIGHRRKGFGRRGQGIGAIDQARCLRNPRT